MVRATQQRPACPGALRDDGTGVGVSLTEAMVQLAASIDRLTRVIATANRMNKPDGWPDEDA